MLIINATRQSILSCLPESNIVCEIGVDIGNYSEDILTNCNPKELHLIDPWLYLVNADLNMGNFIWTYNREVFMIDAESLKFTKNPDQYLYKLLLKRIVHKDLILVYLEEYSKYKNVDSIIKECEKRNWRWK